MEKEKIEEKNTGENKKSNLEKKTGKIVLFCIVTIFSFLVYAYMAFVAFHNGATVPVYEKSGDESHVFSISDGTAIKTTFTVETDTLYGVALYMDTGDNMVNGVIHVNLLNEAGNVIAEAEKSSIIETDGKFIFNTPVTDVEGEQLILQILGSEFQTEETVLLFGTDANITGEDFVPAFGVIVSGKDVFFTLQNVVYLILIVVILSTFGILLLGKSHELHMERNYLIAGLGLGIIFILLIPMMAVPDEAVHLYTAYDVSNTIMGSHSETVTMRADDAFRCYNERKLDRDDYIKEYDGIFTGVKNAELVQTNITATGNPRYIYLLPAFGITLGRLFGLSTTLTYLLGRLFNMLAFVAAVYYSIKRMPFGKGIVFVWALLPITLQQTGSFSYDAPVFSLSIMIIASTLNLAYRTEYNRKKDRITAIVLVMSCVLLLPCKGHALLPLVVLPLMLIPKYIKEHRDTVAAWKTKIRSWMKGAVAAVLLLFLIIVGIVGVQLLRSLTAPENINNNYIAWAGQYGYTIGFFIKNPVRLIEILINTAWFKGDMYLSQMLGGSLGWLDIEIPWMFIIGFLFLLVYAAMRRENETQLITIGDRVWMILVFIGVCALAVAAMLLYWTPNSFYTIEGVQGRYFLPALVLGVLALRTKKTSVSENADTYVMLWTVILQIFVITAVFKNIL